MWFLAAYPYLVAVFTFIVGIISALLGINDDPESPLTTVFALLMLMVPYIAALTVAIKERKNVTPKSNMIVKLAHIPAYVVVFVIALGSIASVVGAMMVILYFFVDVSLIIISGIYMTGLKDAAGWQKLLGFVFVADVITAVSIYLNGSKERN